MIRPSFQSLTEQENNPMNTNIIPFHPLSSHKQKKELNGSTSKSKKSYNEIFQCENYYTNKHQMWLALVASVWEKKEENDSYH